MPVTEREKTAINPPAGAPSLTDEQRRQRPQPVSYDFRLFLPRPDEDPLVTARRLAAIDAASPTETQKETRKRQIADALLSRIPTLQTYQFPYHQIASFERISPEQARDKYRHLELSSPDGGNGLLVTLGEDEASVCLPFWHEKDKANKAFQEVWVCLETICRQAGYVVYAPQMERLLDLGSDAAEALACYTRAVNQLREGHSGSAPTQTSTARDVAIRELAKSDGCGVVLVAVSDNGALHGFAEISVNFAPVNGSPARTNATVTGWYVEPALRGRGIGRRLREAAREWMMSRGLTESPGASNRPDMPPTGMVGFPRHLSPK